MRLLVTGGSGYLGRRLVALAAADQLLYTYFSEDPLGVETGRFLDIRNPTAVHDLIASWQPDAIIHTAGSDRSPDMTTTIVEGTRHVRDAAARYGARLVHLSTDVLFDGTAAPYVEPDPPAPIHAYGRAKAAAEHIVADHPDHVIVRTSLIYGLQRMDHGTRSFVAALRAGTPITLFTNQIRNPVWVDSLAHALLELLSHAYRGILHVAGAQALSRAEFGLRMLDYWGVTSRDTLNVGPDESGRWPRDCRLSIERAQQMLRTPLPGVDAVLQRRRS